MASPSPQMPQTYDFPLLVAALHAAQAEGKASPPGEISRAELALHLRLSPSAVARLESVALAKVTAALRRAGITANPFASTPSHPSTP